MDKYLENYTKEMRAKGYSDQDITKALEKSGWPQKDIAEVLAQKKTETSKIYKEVLEIPQQKTMDDLIATLKSAGWSQEEIEEAFRKPKIKISFSKEEIKKLIPFLITRKRFYIYFMVLFLAFLAFIYLD